MVSTAVTHPLDVVRARLTVQDLNTTNGTARYTGILNAFQRITTEEGVRGLYKGSILFHDAKYSSYSALPLNFKLLIMRERSRS